MKIIFGGLGVILLMLSDISLARESYPPYREVIKKTGNCNIYLGAGSGSIPDMTKSECISHAKSVFESHSYNETTCQVYEWSNGYIHGHYPDVELYEPPDNIYGYFEYKYDRKRCHDGTSYRRGNVATFYAPDFHYSPWQCPSKEEPYATEGADENNDGKIDACYLPFVEDPICDDLGDSLTEMDSQTRAKLANLLNDVRNEVSSHSVALNGGGNKCGLKSLRKRLGFKSIKNKNFKKFVSQLKKKVNTIEGKLSGNIDDFSGAEIGVPRILAADLSRKGVEGRLCTITDDNAPFSREDLVLDKNQINKYGDYFVSDKELRDTALHEYGHSAGGEHSSGEGGSVQAKEIALFDTELTNFSKFSKNKKKEFIEDWIDNPYVFNSLVGDLGCD